MLTKVKAQRVAGLDCSTRSLAYAVWDGGPITCGEVMFEGATVFERLKDAKKKTAELVRSGVLKADYIAIESAVMVKSVQVAIDLAYVYGAVIGELMEHNPEVHKVAPISWQSGIGNPNLKKDEKEQIKKDNPGKTATWYSNQGRKIRKARTLQIVGKYFTTGDNDNIGDACGLAMYTAETLTHR